MKVKKSGQTETTPISLFYQKTLKLNDIILGDSTLESRPTNLDESIKCASNWVTLVPHLEFVNLFKVLLGPSTPRACM